MSDLKIGLIGGSGLGAAMASQTQGHRHDVDTPFGKPSDVIVETEWSGVPVLFLSRHGPGHLLNPSQVPYRANIFALKQLGCTHLLASGAVGSLREEFKPRDLVIPEQIIDKTHKRANTFFDKAAVHVEFAEPFCPVLRQIMVEAGEETGASNEGGDTGAKDSASSLAPRPSLLAPRFYVHDRGCYVAMEGPAFGTRAESLMHRLWGGDLIGMTAMPEAKLAREAELPYALLALVTDYDCWRSKPAAALQTPGNTPEPKLELDPFLLLKEIIANMEVATENAIALLRKAVALMNDRRDLLKTCPTMHALRLGIWSDKAAVDEETRRLLAPLWIKYFDAETSAADERG